MKYWNDMPFSQKILWRIRLLWLLIICMLGYMVVIVELGGGDSRIMSPLAETMSRFLYFGGLIFAAWRIYANKKLLKNRLLMKEQQRRERDERQQSLHEKSGGVVVDILLGALMLATFTASLFDMAAFSTALALLFLTIFLKCAAYFLAQRGMI